jgi:hypothetical protein
MTSRSFDGRWHEAVGAELAAQPVRPTEPLRESDLAGLPDPVRRYVLASGAIGRPRPANVRITFDAVMRRKPGESGMRATSTQVNWFERPARFFLMQARMFGLPVRALHLYRGGDATFQVRAAGLLTMVDESGDGISRAETVTVLNDLCLFAPAMLGDSRLAWTPVDDRTADVTFTNGRRVVSARLLFNERDEIADFWSDDRPENTDKGWMERRWRTPMSEYQDFHGRRLPGRGLAVYDRPEGPFTYGDFTVRAVEYDVTTP